MVTGIENPRSTTDTAAINSGFEENAMAILDSTGVRDSRDVLDDKLSFLEAVRAAWLLSDSPTPPSWKMFDAIFQILRGSNSLELAMASYQLLTELDNVRQFTPFNFIFDKKKSVLFGLIMLNFVFIPLYVLCAVMSINLLYFHLSGRMGILRSNYMYYLQCYPRIYLKRPDNMEFMPGSCSAGVGELVVDKEAWSPFCFGSKAGRSEGEGMSINSHYVDSLRFSTLIEEIGQAVNRRNSQLLIKHAENMLLFQYLVSVVEIDFLLRNTLFKETLDWILLRESLISMLLGSRRVNFKGVVRDCMSIISVRCHHHTDISLRDLKDAPTVSSSAKTAHDCDVALAFTATQLERQTHIAMQRFLTLVMELDVIKKAAELHGLTSRADGLRLPVLDIILDELTYVKDNLSLFLEAFSEPRWKLEIILQYFAKYCPEFSIRTRRSNDSPKVATIEDILNYFSSSTRAKAITRKVAPKDAQLLVAHAFQAYLSVHHDKEHIANNAEMLGTSTLLLICNGLISAFQTIRKIDENLEIRPFEKEALFTAITIVSRKL